MTFQVKEKSVKNKCQGHSTDAWSNTKLSRLLPKNGTKKSYNGAKANRSLLWIIKSVLLYSASSMKCTSLKSTKHLLKNKAGLFQPKCVTQQCIYHTEPKTAPLSLNSDVQESRFMQGYKKLFKFEEATSC